MALPRHGFLATLNWCNIDIVRGLVRVNPTFTAHGFGLEEAFHVAHDVLYLRVDILSLFGFLGLSGLRALTSQRRLQFHERLTANWLITFLRDAVEGLFGLRRRLISTVINHGPELGKWLARSELRR